MRIVRLKGGLGNQMFQYSYALLLKKSTGEKVYLDFSSYKALEADNIRVPRIVKFNISLAAASSEDISQICKLKHNRNSQTFLYRVGIFIERIINSKYFIEPNRSYITPSSIINYLYFDGYWQSWKYVDEVVDILEEEFVPKQELSNSTACSIDAIKNENAVFVGVRRGDYCEERSHYGSFESGYYERAMSYIDSKINSPVYYIFSNDIEWCKKYINWGNHNIIFRETQSQIDDFEELMIMKACKHAIIVNSTFYWWGAKLIANKDKIVCCPTKWFFDNKPIDIIPIDWVRIEN